MSLSEAAMTLPEPDVRAAMGLFQSGHYLDRFLAEVETAIAHSQYAYAERVVAGIPCDGVPDCSERLPLEGRAVKWTTEAWCDRCRTLAALREALIQRLQEARQTQKRPNP